MPRGAIRRLARDRGFGFMRIGRGEALFFHRIHLQGVDFDSLREGQEVEFEIGKRPDGRPQAVIVRLPRTKGV